MLFFKLVMRCLISVSFYNVRQHIFSVEPVEYVFTGELYTFESTSVPPLNINK